MMGEDSLLVLQSSSTLHHVHYLPPPVTSPPPIPDPHYEHTKIVYAEPRHVNRHRKLSSDDDNESNSSGEIHYGPGFVSRLKSRYMSVALRGSSGGYAGSGGGQSYR